MTLRILVGISGGIAAYKAASLIRLLVQDGHEVHAVPTTAALRFIGKPTLEALSRNPVTSDVFDDVAEVRHVALGQRADLIIVAPATANTLAKLANGQADDLLGTSVLASSAPLVIAPAMHTEMWQHPATQDNVAKLTEHGARFVGPDAGELTGGDVGAGRLADPERIVREALAVVGDQSMRGTSIVISAGGTHESIDPVRFIGNRSSGAMGVALADRALARGANVTLVGANLQVKPPAGADVVSVESTAELRDAMLARASADIVIMAAAVSDYRVASDSDAKLKKDTLGANPSIELVENPDILAELAHAKRSNTVVGFAAETESEEDALIALGRAKLERKGTNLLVVNRVGTTAGFGERETSVTVLDANGIVAAAAGTKMSVADVIMDAIAQHKETS